MNLFACSSDLHTSGCLAGDMAEQSSPFPALFRPGRGPSRPLIAIAAIVLAGAGLGGAPSPPPALEPDRARLVRIRAEARTRDSVRVGKLGLWVRLRSVLPAIRRTPSSRLDTPALPTVGRPRDGPRVCAVRGAGARTRGSAPRVLVVDDEASIAELVALALRHERFVAATAGDGVSALLSQQSFAPDLVVLDLMLPDLGGFTVAERLRAVEPEIPIVFLSASASDQDRARAVSLGQGYFCKPFGLRELLAHISALLQDKPLSNEPKA
jgi:CheY-like chemotaxis protein